MGETVLDLGSGGGKICYIASQIVGAEGKVLGVDMNDDMLALARQHRQQVGDAIGYHNVDLPQGSHSRPGPSIWTALTSIFGGSRYSPAEHGWKPRRKLIACAATNQ